MATKAKHESNWDGVSVRDCACCGKTFVIHPGWVYRLRIKQKLYVYCSYTCFRKAQKKDRTAMIPDRGMVHDRYTAEYDRKHADNYRRKIKE